MAERIHQERQLRRAGILPVHIRGCDAYGKDISQVACTLNISKHGVRLVGLMRRLKVRSTVWLRYHQEERRFQVVWARKENGRREWQAGLRCLEPECRLWSVELACGLDPENGWKLLKDTLAEVRY